MTGPAAHRPAVCEQPPDYSDCWSIIGAIGFLAYELLHDIKIVLPNPTPDLGGPDCHRLFCDWAPITDELECRSWWGVNGREAAKPTAVRTAWPAWRSPVRHVAQIHQPARRCNPPVWRSAGAVTTRRTAYSFTLSRLAHRRAVR